VSFCLGGGGGCKARHLCEAVGRCRHPCVKRSVFQCLSAVNHRARGAAGMADAAEALPQRQRRGREGARQVDRPDQRVPAEEGPGQRTATRKASPVEPAFIAADELSRGAAAEAVEAETQRVIERFEAKVWLRCPTRTCMHARIAVLASLTTTPNSWPRASRASAVAGAAWGRGRGGCAVAHRGQESASLDAREPVAHDADEQV
jgi:hypothetical protein